MKVEIKNKVIPCQLKHNFKYENYKVTQDYITVFTALQIKQYNSGRWLIATAKKHFAKREDETSTFNFTAPIGAVVQFYFETGSWKHRWHIKQYFLVAERTDQEVEIDGDKYSVKNLQPLPKLDDGQLGEVEAEILNNVADRLSKYHPVRTLYYYWCKEKVHEKITPPQPRGEASEEEAFAGWESGVAEVKTTAVAQPSPQAEPEIDFEKIALKAGLRRVKIIVFDLPTEYLGSKTKYEKNGQGIAEIKQISAETATYRTLRKQFYAALHGLAYRTKAGWILLQNADITKLNPIISQLNNLAKTKRAIELVEAYFPSQTLKVWLAEYIAEVRANRAAIIEKIQEKANEVSAVKRLQKQLQELNQELSQLEAELKLL